MTVWISLPHPGLFLSSTQNTQLAMLYLYPEGGRCVGEGWVRRFPSLGSSSTRVMLAFSKWLEWQEELAAEEEMCGTVGVIDREVFSESRRNVFEGRGYSVPADFSAPDFSVSNASSGMQMRHAPRQSYWAQYMQKMESMLFGTSFLVNGPAHPRPEHKVIAVDVYPFKSRIAAALSDQTVRVYDMERKVWLPNRYFHRLQQAISSVKWVPLRQNQLVVGGVNGVSVWNIQVKPSAAGRVNVNGLEFVRSNPRALPDSEGKFKPTLQLCYPAGHHHVSCMAFRADGLRLATGSSDPHSVGLVIWDFSRVGDSADGPKTAITGSMYVALDHFKSPVSAVCWSPDGRLLIVGHVDGTVRTWRTGDKSQRWSYETWTKLGGRLKSVAFSPSCRFFLLAMEKSPKIYVFSVDPVTAVVRGIQNCYETHLPVEGIAWNKQGKACIWFSDTADNLKAEYSMMALLDAAEGNALSPWTSLSMKGLESPLIHVSWYNASDENSTLLIVDGAGTFRNVPFVQRQE